MKNLGLKWKIMIILAVIVPVLTGITFYMTRSFSDQMHKTAEEQSLEMAYRFANQIDAEMGLAMFSARTFARITETMAGHEGGFSREALKESMEYFLQDHTNLLGIYCVLEPDALDGKDAEYSGAEYHNADGRFVPWVHFEGSTIATTASVAYETETANSAWYYIPKRTGKETIMEPWTYNIAGEQVLMVDMIVPLKKNGRFLGVLGIDFPMGTVDAFVSNIKVFTSGYAFLLSNAGTFIAHPDSETFVDKKVNIFDHPDTTPEVRKGLERVLRGESFSMQTVEDGEPQLLTFVPIFIGRSDTPLMFGLKVPLNEALAEANAMGVTATGVGIAAVLLIFAVILFISRAITTPIKATVEAVEAIAGGDLSTRLPADATDEVGRMQAAVNNMAEDMARHMDEIVKQQAAAEEKTRLAEVATQEAEEARKQAEEARREGMLTAAGRLEQIVAHVSGASEEISVQSNEIRNGTDIQRERISSTATAMEEMNITVLEVARNAGETADQAGTAKDNALEGAQVVNDSVEAMLSIQREADGLKETMAQLGNQAEAIGAIMNVIEDIADQTNLLALNAAIEAARAGEAGRGFAVVADEVRKLAEKTMGATKEVGDSIRSIQQVAKGNIEAMDSTVGKIAAATELSSRSGEMLQAIVEGVEASAERIQSIATAAEQQSATSEEINQSVDEINQITLDTSEAVGEAAMAAARLAEQAQELEAIIQDMKHQE